MGQSEVGRQGQMRPQAPRNEFVFGTFYLCLEGVLRNSLLAMGIEMDAAQPESVHGVKRTTPGWIAAISFVLVPVATLLIFLELFGGVVGVRHYIDATDISSKRREWSIIYFMVVGLVGPIVVSVIWFDPLRIEISKELRLRLFGVVGLTIGFLAGLLLLPY